MTNRELSDYIKQARKVGQSDEEIRKDLLEVSWGGEDIDEALVADHKVHGEEEAPWKIKLENLVEKARIEGKSDEDIRKELSKLAWKEGDIDDALNFSPKSLYTYKEENIDATQNTERANILTWRPNFTNVKKFIATEKRYLISAGLTLILVFIGVGYSIIYLNNIRVRKEAIAQTLQTLPDEEKNCVLNKVDVGFLEKIRDPQVFSEKYYREQMELLSGCVLHKATPL